MNIHAGQDVESPQGGAVGTVDPNNRAATRHDNFELRILDQVFHKGFFNKSASGDYARAYQLQGVGNPLVKCTERLL